MNKTELTKRLKEKAGSIGFDLIGVVRPEKLTDEGELFEEWLRLGNQGEMQWIEKESYKRYDPEAIFPGVKSMIALAVNYYSPEQHSAEIDVGKISRYAWGDDYHKIIKNRLFELLEWMEKEVPASKGKVCVDTVPVLEKAWAVRAGLGWLGKHTNVISKEFGSWVFLGEILTDIEFEFDEHIIEDHCGSCTACLDACPTGAITEPYLVDSNLCISYATIELRSEELPENIGDKLEGWLYGCDICQDVCPWNRFQTPTSEAGFKPRPQNNSPKLDDILSLTREDYVERFRNSAVKRTKLSGLKRNAGALKKHSFKHKNGEE